MPRAFLIKGKTDRKRSTQQGDDIQNRSVQIQADFSNQDLEAVSSPISPPLFIQQGGDDSRTENKTFLENEDSRNGFRTEQRVSKTATECAPRYQIRKTKGTRKVKAFREDIITQERPAKKRRKQQQPYHKVVYYYPVPEPEQIEEIEEEHESQIAQPVPHEIHHYANCSANNGVVPRLPSREQTDSSRSPGSETAQPCYYYPASQESSAQAQAQPRSRENSDSRDEAAKQLDFERLDRGLSEAEILQRKRERSVAKEKQSLSQQYVVVEHRIPPKTVVGERNIIPETVRSAEVEVPPNVQYIPLETRPSHEYQRQHMYANAVEETEETSGVPEISSVGVLRECAPTSPPSSAPASSYASATSQNVQNYSRSAAVTYTYPPTATVPTIYQEPAPVTASCQPQPNKYPPQLPVATSYQPRPVAPIYPPQLSPVTTSYAPQASPVTTSYPPQASPVTTSYPPQASPVTTSYPPQASPVAGSFPPQPTAFGFPPQPNPVSATYPPPQPSQATTSYPPQHNYAPQPSPVVMDAPQTEPKINDTGYPQVASPKVGQTPPIVHYVPVYAVQGPSGEQKYVAGPPINNPPVDPSKVIPPPQSVLEKYPSAPSIPQAVQQNAIAYPSNYRARVSSDPGPTASASHQLQPRPAPQFQQAAVQPAQPPQRYPAMQPQPQRYPVTQPQPQPYPPPHAYVPQQLQQQQTKQYQTPQQLLHYAPPQRNIQHSKVYRVPEVCKSARAMEEQEENRPIQIRRIENHAKRAPKHKQNRPVMVVVPPNKDCRDIPSSPDSFCSNPSPGQTVTIKTEPSDNPLSEASCVITPPGSPDDEDSESDEGETYTVVMRDQGMQTIPEKVNHSKLTDKTNSRRNSYFNKTSPRKREHEQTRKIKQVQKENIYVQNNNLPTMAVIVPRPSHMSPPDAEEDGEDPEIDRYHCTFCDKGFQWHSHLKSHERTHTGEKPFKCSECGRCFTRADGLQCHMLVHNKKKPFKCQYCNKSFSESSQLEKHVYLHTGVKPFKCEYCGRAFSDSQSIEKHLLVHTGTKPYKCQYCVRSFNDSQMLVKHIRSHTGEKPFKCCNCTMAFSKQSALIIHNRVHTGEKPYQCPHCRKSFSISGNLQRHILIHTGERPYRCSKCPKAFNNPSHLSRHISKLHAPRSEDGPVSQVRETVTVPVVEISAQ